MKEIATEYGIKSAEVTINEHITIESLIDAFSRNRVYIPALYVLNKVDELTDKKDSKYLYISADKEVGMEDLKQKIWSQLGLQKVFLVRRDEDPNTHNPIIVKNDISLKEIAETIGTEFAEGKKRAKIWGSGAKFPGQEVSLKTKAQEAMQIRFL
jgi:hypothetical protein